MVDQYIYEIYSLFFYCFLRVTEKILRIQLSWTFTRVFSDNFSFWGTDLCYVQEPCLVMIIATPSIVQSLEKI